MPDSPKIRYTQIFKLIRILKINLLVPIINNL